MIAQPRQVTCQKIMAAAREQAWTSSDLVLGLPARLGDEPEYTRHWDLTAISEVLEQAKTLRWGPEELTARDHDDVEHHFAIVRPGHRPGDPVSRLADYVVAGPDFDELLRLAQDEGFLIGQTGRGKSVWSASMVMALDPPGTWTILCPAPNPDCAQPQDTDLSRAEAQALASDHDGLHHDGSPTAEVAPALEMTR